MKVHSKNCIPCGIFLEVNPNPYHNLEKKEDGVEKRQTGDVVDLNCYWKKMEKNEKVLFSLARLNESAGVEFVLKQRCLGARKDGLSKTLILDLDETLIYRRGSKLLIRPFAVELIMELSRVYEIIIFTASEEAHTLPVIKELDPLGVITAAFFRDSCCSSSIPGILIKDLRIFQDRKFTDICIVDDNILSFAYQTQNGIPILPFLGQKHDNELIKLYYFLISISQFKDLRIPISKTFNLQV
jgi:hypothetical protein